MPAVNLVQEKQIPDQKPAANVAESYNQAGDDYRVYADGDPTRLLAFDGPHAYADGKRPLASPWGKQSAISIVFGATSLRGSTMGIAPWCSSLSGSGTVR
jgi:hypothetical protein